MSKNRKNPYTSRRNGLYTSLFGFMMKKQYYTRPVLIAEAVRLGASDKRKPGKSTSPAEATVTVMLSPRKTSKIGNPCGNISAQGHLYYNEKLPRKTVRGEKEPQKFRLRWREKALEPVKHPDQVRVWRIVADILLALIGKLARACMTPGGAWHIGPKVAWQHGH